MASLAPAISSVDSKKLLRCRVDRQPRKSRRHNHFPSCSLPAVAPSIPVHHHTSVMADTSSPADEFHRCPEPSCRRQFGRKYSLGEHMKTHTGEKPHVCPVRTCAKRFSTSGNLSRHKRLHGYIEPLQCPVQGCICTFPSDGKLEKHMKFHYGGPVHLCEVPGCGKTFSTTGNLNRHAKNHHLDISIAIDNRSPTTTDAWQPQFAARQCRLKRAWSTGTNPLPAETLRESGEPLEPVDETLDNLSALLVETGLDEACNDRKSNLVDDIIRFHVQELGYSDQA